MKYLLLLTLVILSQVCRGQDIVPGQQAQGYLNDKNAMVDHVTGIFRYRVPLYILGNGSVSLPISLDYIAKGVKLEDKPGLVGYNWTLNTGGVVTRTIRGGFPDEYPLWGYIWGDRRENALPLEDDIKSVNKRERDGECDIFTAVFNGQSVDFLISLTDDNKIRVETLERTNVSVVCDYNSGEIDGWCVTDENGNRYVYRQKEWTTNIIRENAVSLNGIRGRSYISSWYLSRIEPCNGTPLLFNYLEKVNPDGVQNNINKIQYNSYYPSKYQYGSPMRERTFDFSKYRTNFDRYIAAAKRFLGNFSYEQQVNNWAVMYTTSSRWVYNSNFQVAFDNIQSNFRIMGLLSDFQNVTTASNELIKALDQLIAIYKDQSSLNAQMAASNFESAKREVIKSLEDVNYNIMTRETWEGSSMIICSPILDNIVCGDKMLRLCYPVEASFWNLTGIQLYDAAGCRISETRIEQNQEHLSALSFRDRNGSETDRMSFSYYQAPSVSGMEDCWGFRKPNSGVKDEKYLLNVDAGYAKAASLETITLPGGGKIHIDYESNRVDINSENYGIEGSPYGGIRLKSVVFGQQSDGLPDTVLYYYPLAGKLVCGGTNHEFVDYGGGFDQVTHSRVKPYGVAFLTAGNNGIYYPYVREVSSVKGSRGYLFQVLPPENINFAHPFWLNGLLLAVADYDRRGSLKRLIKNSYYTDLSHGVFNTTDLESDHFSDCNEFMKYSRNLLQVKAYEYYLDKDKLERMYPEDNNIFIYQDGLYSYYMNPYREFYLPNMESRCSNLRLPQQLYTLCYGGRTLLKGQLEYHFEGHITDHPDITDFSRYIPENLFRSTEYFYDNPEHSIHATRIVNTDSKGNKYTIVQKRVTEIDNVAAPFIGKMKQANILTPVIKELNMVNNCLLNEHLSLYTCLEADGKCYAGLAGKHIYSPSDEVNLSFINGMSLDNTLFSYGESTYALTDSSDYQYRDSLYLPVESSSRSEQTALDYDFRTGQLILKAGNVPHGAAAAADIKKYDEIRKFAGQFKDYTSIYNCFENFCKLYSQIVAENHSEYIASLINSPEQQRVVRLINMVVAYDRYRLDELKILGDSINSRGSNDVPYFIGNLTMIFQTCRPELIIPQRDITQIAVAIRGGVVTSSDFHDIILNGIEEFRVSPVDSLLSITAVSSKMKLYVLSVNSNASVVYKVSYGGGNASGQFRLSATVGTSLQTFDIDLSAYMGVTSLTVAPSSVSGIGYIALVPADAEFEATSYNRDGSIFCKFNQKGELERYEYDAAGRVTKVFDQDNNLLRENKYNTFLTQ